jgi:hypothetical protein
MGRYITEELSPRVSGGLKWEKWIRANREQQRRLYLGIDPLFVIYPGISIFALAASCGPVIASMSRSYYLGTFAAGAWIFGAILAILTFGQIWSVRRETILLNWGRALPAVDGPADKTAPRQPGPDETP